MLKTTKNLFFIVITCLVAPLSGLSQKKLQKFGKVDIADLQMTTCSYDKDAVAMKLIESGHLYYEKGNTRTPFTTIYEKRVRVKILKEAGLKYANVEIPFRSKNSQERILDLDAYVYNVDEKGEVKTTKVGGSSIYTKKINNQYSQEIIAFPEVKIGSVFEYKYKLERSTFSNLPDWEFQDNIPVATSQFTVSVLEFFRFNVQPYVVEPIDVKKETKYENITLQNGFLQANVFHTTYTMENLKALPDEVFMGSSNDYQQRLSFQLTGINYPDGQVERFNSTWPAAAKLLREDEDFGLLLDSDTKAGEELINELKLKATDEEKLQAGYAYFKKNFVWDKNYSIYSFAGLKDTWKKKTGTTGDINLLFIYLMRKAGLEAKPIVMSTRGHGIVNTAYPFLDQFNVTFAQITIGAKKYVVNAADKFGHYKFIPERVNYSEGFVIDNVIGTWQTALDSTKIGKNIIATEGTINANGVMKGKSVVSSGGYARQERMEDLVTSGSSFKETYFKSNDKSVVVEDLEVTNQDDEDKPLQQTVNFNYKLNSSGNYKFFNYNFFSNFISNPFTKDVRVTDIEFGYPETTNIYGFFTLPEGYAAETLPANTAITVEDRSIIFRRNMEVEENTIRLTVVIEFKKPIYPSKDYDEFKNFYKKVFDLMNEQVVLKKK